MANRQPPRGISRLLWRTPILLFRLGLSKLFGKKFLLLKHIGRKSGNERFAALEVVRYDSVADTYIVASGFGFKSDWYQNLKINPNVSIQVDGKSVFVHANIMSHQESGEEMAIYADTHPKLAKNLIKVIGHQVPDSIDGYRELAEKFLPFVTFEPRVKGNS